MGWRPKGAPVAGPGQESVWDYPRPPRLERVTKRVTVAFAGVVVADTTNAVRVLETASPPTYYLPPADVRTDLLQPVAGRTMCEWKGLASYFDLRVDGTVSRRAAWLYADPVEAFAALRGYVAFYAGRVDRCTVGEATVEPQAGDFYGGWVTPEILGPFKGDPGTLGW